MVDPVNEDGAALVAHPLGKNSGKAILFKEGGDALEQEIFGLVAERPVELIFRRGRRGRFVKHCCRHRSLFKMSSRAKSREPVSCRTTFHGGPRLRFAALGMTQCEDSYCRAPLA